MEVTYLRRVNLAANIWQYFFRTDAKLDFLPGQYGELHLNKVVGDPRGPSRVFSFTSLPDEPVVSIVLKHFSEQSPYKQALAKLKAGDTAKIDNIMGDLVLPKLASQPLIFVAGGIGLASYLAMIQLLLSNREPRQIDFFYQLRSKDEIIFENLLANFPFNSSIIATRPDQLTASLVMKAASDEALIYLSGSQNFVESLRGGLEQLGEPRSRIVFDYYDGYRDL